jgi:hypothetical protein
MPQNIPDHLWERKGTQNCLLLKKHFSKSRQFRFILLHLYSHLSASADTQIQ